MENTELLELVAWLVDESGVPKDVDDIEMGRTIALLSRIVWRHHRSIVRRKVEERSIHGLEKDNNL